MYKHLHHDQQHQRRQQTTTGRLGTLAVLVTLGGLVLADTLIGARAAPPVHAAPARQREPASAAPASVTAVQEGAKTILPETSIAGPGFNGGAIAWTGTDAAHHLNVRTGTGGLTFPTKITLPETSPFAPALTVLPSEGNVALFEVAWTGTDAAHSLNIESLSVSGGSTTAAGKMTLHETSIGAPAIVFDGDQWLAWTGTDANHSLNVLLLSGAQRGQKTVLRQFTSDAGPSLSVFGTNELVLGWSVRGTQRLNFATSTDGVHFTSPLGSGLPQLSSTAPQVVQPGEHSSSNGCIAWTGTDAAHHLNVQCTSQFPQFPDPAQTKTVLPETALGAPGFTGNEIAWTGTDAAHHLNVAQLTLP
jgi:hypothetical protein